MFEQSLVQSSASTRNARTVVISFFGQTILLGVLLLIPMIYFEQLPASQLTSFIMAPSPPPPPPRPPDAPRKAVKVIPRQFDADRLMAPKTIPKEIAMIKEDELPPPGSAGVSGGIHDGQLGGVIDEIIRSVPTAAPPPPPVKVEVRPVTPQRIRVGGNVQQARLIKQPTPLYPPLARQARIEGTVRFTAIIGKDGTIQNLQLISGHPLLVQSAQDAVRQWVYQPTLLNGESVEVVTQIDVNFTFRPG